MAAPAQPGPPVAPARRRSFGRVLGSAATCLVVVGMLGVATKIILMPGGSSAATTTAAWSIPSAGASSLAPSAGAPSAAPSVTPPAGASGAPMPKGNLPGWRQTFADDFTNGFSAKWGDAYEGQPGSDPGGWFDPDHVSVHNGMLTIEASKEQTPHGTLYASGGVTNAKTFSQTYGRFDVRFRMDKGYGIAYVVQLWPTSDQWPPEIDFAEDDAKNRDMTSATEHFGANDQTVHQEVKGDFTAWHTVEVEWDPGKLVYRIDGKVWATMANKSVPKVPMSIAIQTQAFGCGLPWQGCPNATTPARVDMQVDWAVAYTATK
jgi:beta-glucanase (GH16 family)